MRTSIALGQSLDGLRTINGMIYTANITTPKNTAKSAPKITRLQVTNGLVYRVEVFFPKGSSGLMGVVVTDGLYQCWPSNVGEYFIADNDTIGFDDLYIKEAAPFLFSVITYNLDETFDHFVSVRIGLVSKEVYLARFMPTKSYEYLADLLMRLATERKELEMLQRELIQDAPLEWQLSIVPAQDVEILKDG